jgi:hypothetical protein
MPAGGPTALTFDDPALSACGEGTLNINSGGNLILVSGNAVANDERRAVLCVRRHLQHGADRHDHVRAEPRRLVVLNRSAPTRRYTPTRLISPGRLVADIRTTTLLPHNNYFWNNVIDANTRNGTFDQCALVNFNGMDVTNSVLVDFGCIYDAQANVDLGFQRIGFNQITD